MRYGVLIALCACGNNEQIIQPLDVLRDTSRAWTYEVVKGESVEQLAPVPGAPTVKCKIKKRDEQSQWMIDCNATTRVADPNDFGGVLNARTFLVFEHGGVRELVHPGPPPRGQALAFTFPDKLDAPSWTYERGGDFGLHSKVEVRATTRDVLGAPRTVWISSSTYTYSETEPSRRGIAMFAPGVAPVLLCERDREGTAYWCLRLTGVAETKKKKWPKLVPKLPSKQERADLVKMLATMDRVPDLFGDRMHGQLVVRDDVPISGGVYAPILEIEPGALRLDGRPLELPALAEQLARMNSRIRRDVVEGRVPRDQDSQDLVQRINVLVHAATPWQRVREVLQVTAHAGFVQPQLVFARTPSAPRPPPHWIEDATKEAALDNEAAELLGKLTKEILAGCEPLREAFAIDGSMPAADQIRQQLAARIPDAPCMYDIAALRSVLWVTLGTPYPHGVVDIRLDPAGDPVDLPAATPWREAHAKLKPGATVSLLAR